MKKILILTITCLITISSYSQNKFGYIDSQELLLLMPERKTAEEEVQTFAKSLESQLQAMTAEYQQSVQEYQANEATYTDLVKQDKVYTPSLNQNILPGVTRNFIINLLKKNNIEVFEEEISVDSIYECEELWLTSSTKEIQPVAYIDGYKIPTKKTEQLIWNKALKFFKPY